MKKKSVLKTIVSITMIYFIAVAGTPIVNANAAPSAATMNSIIDNYNPNYSDGSIDVNNYVYQRQLNRYYYENINGELVQYPYSSAYRNGICNISALTNLLNRQLCYDGIYSPDTRFNSRYVFYESAYGYYAFNSVANPNNSSSGGYYSYAPTFSNWTNEFNTFGFKNPSGTISDWSKYHFITSLSSSLFLSGSASPYVAFSLIKNGTEYKYAPKKLSMPTQSTAYSGVPTLTEQNAMFNFWRTALNDHPQGIWIQYNYGGGVTHNFLVTEMTGTNPANADFILVDTGTGLTTCTWGNQYYSNLVAGNASQTLFNRNRISFAAYIMNTSETNQRAQESPSYFKYGFSQETFAAATKGLGYTSTQAGNTFTYQMGTSSITLPGTITSSTYPIRAYYVSQTSVSSSAHTYLGPFTDKFSINVSQMIQLGNTANLTTGTYPYYITVIDNIGNVYQRTVNLVISPRIEEIYHD